MRVGRKRVLVVDDDEDIREIITLIVEEEGLEPSAAVDGEDALAQLGSGRKPALVLLDMMMPRLNGADVLSRMRADPALTGIPVVLLSGDLGVRHVAAALGADGSLGKPVELDELLGVIRKYAREERPEERAAPLDRRGASYDLG
jgi:CheY-like chemotaxis protein